MSITKHFLYSNKFKTNVICILYRRNLKEDEVTKNSLIANILSNGSLKYNNMQKFYNKIENMYGAIFDISVIKKSEEHIYQFYFEFIDNNDREICLKEAFDFLTEIIYNPLINHDGFNENYFKIEKSNLKEEIKGKINDKSEYAKDKLIKIMCSEEKFAIDDIGYLSELEKINNKDLYSHYKDVLDTSPINIIVMGNYKDSFVTKVIDNYFSFERENIVHIKEVENVYKTSPTKICKESSDISQSKIIIGLRAKEAIKGKELYSLILFNSIFGGGGDSKLFKNIREEQNLCYYIYSFIYRYKSIIVVESGVDKENINLATKTILDELEDFKKGNFKTSDLSKAKLSLINNFEMIYDGQGRTIDFFISQILAGDTNTIDDCIRIIKDIKVEDIIKSGEKTYVDTIFYLEENK